MRKLNKIIAALFLAVFTISFSVIAVLNIRPVYYASMDRIQAQNPQYSKEMMKENYDILIDYLNPLDNSRLELQGFEMSPQGEFHFEEVKVLFNLVYIAALVSLIVSIGFFLYFLRQRDLTYIRYSAFLTFLIPLLLLIPFALDFSRSFVVFHELAFSNDYWIFDPRIDPVINILPEWFFMIEAFLMVILMAILAVIQFFIGKGRGRDNGSNVYYDQRKYLIK